MNLRKLYLLAVCMIAATVICALLSILARGAQERGMAPTARLGAVAAKPVCDMNGTCMAFPVVAGFHVVEHKPSGEVDARELGSVTFDLVRHGTQTVTVRGETYTYLEIAEALAAVAQKEWRQTMPDPLPTRRAMRSTAP